MVIYFNLDLFKYKTHLWLDKILKIINNNNNQYAAF